MAHVVTEIVLGWPNSTFRWDKSDIGGHFDGRFYNCPAIAVLLAKMLA